MKRTPLRLRQLPDYTRNEEIFNMVSHIVGAAFGILVLVWCIVQSAIKGSGWGIASGIVYGTSVILLYTMSCIYHGLRPNMGKKVMQVLDHCTIYYLIAGTYTPVLLCGLRPQYPGWAWAKARFRGDHHCHRAYPALLPRRRPARRSRRAGSHKPGL